MRAPKCTACARHARDMPGHGRLIGRPEDVAAVVRERMRLRETGALIGIPVLDHLVVTDNSYRSIAEMGVI